VVGRRGMRMLEGLFAWAMGGAGGRLGLEGVGRSGHWGGTPKGTKPASTVISHPRGHNSVSLLLHTVAQRPRHLWIRLRSSQSIPPSCFFSIVLYSHLPPVNSFIYLGT